MVELLTSNLVIPGGPIYVLSIGVGCVKLIVTEQRMMETLPTKKICIYIKDVPCDFTITRDMLAESVLETLAKQHNVDRRRGDWYLYGRGSGGDKLTYVSMYESMWAQTADTYVLVTKVTPKQYGEIIDKNCDMNPRNPRSGDVFFDTACLIYYDENQVNGYLDFDGGCDSDCLGWDPASTRCQCGNRRVKFIQDDANDDGACNISIEAY